jgi:hypothetical protein
MEEAEGSVEGLLIKLFDLTICAIARESVSALMTRLVVVGAHIVFQSLSFPSLASHSRLGGKRRGRLVLLAPRSAPPCVSSSHRCCHLWF